MRLFQRLPWTLVAAAALSLSVACGDETSNGDGNGSNGTGNGTGNGGADAGPSDVGGGNGGNGGTDAGPVVCNPVDGSGCPNANQRCVLAIENGGTSTDSSCRSTTLDLAGLEEECDPVGQNCEAGLVCTNFQGDPNPLCRKVCTAGGGTECANLSGAADSYTCNEFDDNYGVCLGFSGCQPPVPESCPPDQTCNIIDNQTLETGCTPAGPGMAGSSCQTAGCANGFICLNLGDGAVCWEACDQSNACSDGNQECAALQDIDFGVCTDPPQDCNPAEADACPAGQTCSIVDANGNTGCTPAGMAQVGEPCGAGAACVRGAICLNIDGGGAQCWQGCDDANACSGGEMCQALQNVDWGVCQ